MIKRLIFSFMAASYLTLAMAEIPPPIPHNAAISKIVMGLCYFRINRMFGGRLLTSPEEPFDGLYAFPATGPQSSPVLYGGINLYCVNANDRNRIAIELGAKQINSEWRQQDRDDNWIPFDKQQHVHVIPLKGGNWTGIGITVDDTTGDEQQRARVLSFCVQHKAQALCGSTPIMWLAKPKVNELWKVKAILNSIEFLDTSAPGAAQP